MHFLALLTAAFLAIFSVTATPVSSDASDAHLVVANQHATNAVTQRGRHFDDIGKLPSRDLPDICLKLPLLPMCTDPPPPPPPPLPSPPQYTRTFASLNASIEGEGYMTYRPASTVNACKDACDSVEGCVFVNSYNNVNGEVADASLTCSMYSQCHGAANATNRGGQNQQGNSTNFIRNSDGYCKKGQ